MAATEEIDEERTSSRRALLGIGALLAAGAVAGEVLESGEAAEAAPAVHHGRQYSSASAAAKAVSKTHSGVFPHDPAAHLLRRATFGPRPADVAHLKKIGIDRWLAEQLNPTAIRDTAGDGAAKSFPLAGAGPHTIKAKSKQYSWDAMLATAQGTLAKQVFSQRQVYEIVVDLFSNHLHVPLPGEQWQTSPSYIQNVIRRYAFGRFDDMLHAAMKHPAMLNFLSNDQSQKQNVNENLGRELLELHTVGLAAGYTEAMVRSSATILSGRTWDYNSGTYGFNDTQHATGHVRVLGFSDANRSATHGEALGDRYLTYLSHHRLTAKNIARKIAVRFVSDTPSDDLVNRLANVYLASGTSIKAVVDAVFKSSDFWAAVGVRMRRPLEDAVGAMRVLDVRTAPKMTSAMSNLFWTLNDANHTPYGWGPPNGYPDVAAAWLGAGAMLSRWNLHRAVVYGWWKPLDWTPASKLVAWRHGMSAMEWTRSVAHRLLGMTPPKHALVAALKGAKLTPSMAAPTDDWTCGKVVALLLDSPYFQLR